MTGCSKEEWAETLQVVDEVLFYLWDPAGLSQQLGCRDEYQEAAEECTHLVVRREWDNAISLLQRHVHVLGGQSAGLPSSRVVGILREHFG